MKNSNFSIKDPRNLSILTDFYELTMANGFFQAGRKDDIGVFDLFFRRVPDNGGFAISAGLVQAMDYLENLHFDDASEISEYAVSAMNWAVGNGFIDGRSESELMPGEFATRAEIAMFITEYIENK